jgi:L-ascorbate metabolism protein UlaG (beta-lactamase superfamily)
VWLALTRSASRILWTPWHAFGTLCPLTDSVSDTAAHPARIGYVGHATVVIDLDGVRVLTDPVLRNRIAHLRRKVPVDAKSLRGVDVALVSHGHYDHLDLPSLEKLGRELPVVVPYGLGGLLRRRGFRGVLEVHAGDVLQIGALSVRAVRAEHEGGRGPFGASGEALGYVISGTRSIYFAGDTDLFDGMEEEVGDVDVGLIPIWGWGPTLGKGGHLDPERAAEAVHRLAPRLVIPIHWGTYFPLHLGLRGLPAFLDLPPAAFVAATGAVAPEVEVRVLRPGERTEL